MKVYWTPLYYLVLFAILMSACAGVAPAPVDGDVVNLLSGTTNWIINQASGRIPPAGVEVLYNCSKELLVVGSPFQSGYGFTVLDAKTFSSLDNPEVAKSITGNYVNWKTWAEFRDFLLNNGWVTQIVTFTSSATMTWYTIFVGVGYVPDTLDLLGYQEGIEQ